MRRTLLTIMVISCSVGIGFSQSFVPGVVITTEGDSLKGFIRDYNNRTPREIIFKKNESESEGVTYTPQQIKGFVLHGSGERFISTNIDVDKKPVDLTRLESDRYPKFVKSWVFIKLIAGGKASLYYLQDESAKEHYFLQVDGGRIEELQYIVYMSTANMQTEWPVFTEQLKQKLNGCEKAANYSSTRYTASSLKKVVSTYNQCFANSSNYTEAKQKRRILPYVLVGFTSGTGTYFGRDAFVSSISQTSNIAFPRSSSPMFGFGIEAFSRKSKFAVALELNYRSHNFAGTDDQGVDYKNSELGFTLYQLNTMLTYHFTGGDFKPYLRVGPTFSITSLTKNHMTVYRRVPPLVSKVYEGEVSITSNGVNFHSSLGFVAAAGLTRGRLGAEARYQLTSITAPEAYFHISEVSMVLFLRFGK